MKNFTFKMFQTMSVSEIESMAADRNYETDFMILWIKFTARMAKHACVQVKRSILGLMGFRSCTAGKLADHTIRTSRTIYPLGYDYNAATLDRKDVRFVIAHTNWKNYLLDQKLNRLIMRLANKLEDAIEMELTLQEAQKVLICRK